VKPLELSYGLQEGFSRRAFRHYLLVEVRNTPDLLIEKVI
jgi:hypothetical protein